MLDRMLLASASEEKLFVEDCFATNLYTGTGSTQTITNGIDLSGKGGLVWAKSRSAATSNFLFDTARGGSMALVSNNTSNQIGYIGSLTAFNSNGFTLGSGTGAAVNLSADNYASWTFRKAPKFFDIVTWTGDGSFTRTISHSLGIAPGCMIVKITSATGDWIVYHQGINGGVNPRYYSLRLNLTDAARGDSIWNYAAPTGSNFQVTDQLNASGSTYVAYLFAHDATADGIIQCGSFDIDGSGNATVNLGWEPQWVLMKTYEAASSFCIYDNMRGMPVGNTNVARLFADSANAEGNSTDYNVSPTATGFTAKAIGYTGSSANGFIYIAIRRGPMKTPTLGTSVFAPVTTNSAATGTVQTTGFPVDLQFLSIRNNVTYGGFEWMDRLRGVSSTSTELSYNLGSYRTSAEYQSTYARNWNNTGFSVPSPLGNTSFGFQTIFYNFRRAPGFFDVVCYTGTGVARTVNHNLGVVPELIITKERNNTTSWAVYSGDPTKVLILNTTAAITSATSGGYTYWNNTAPTKTNFSVGVLNHLVGSTVVAYLFASCPGVSKVFSFTGNGSSQTINCGFSNGARFILIKRTDSTGDWYVWDTARGLVSANDPHLSLNSTAAEVTTDDSIDPNATGFIVNQVSATNINVNGATYIGLAVA